MRFQVLASASVVLLTSLGQAGGRTWPSNPELRAQICVERSEEHGSLNIRPADVVIGPNGPILTLFGDQAACAFVRSGTYTVHAQSADPYDPASKNPTAWKSKPISIKVVDGQRADIEVCGTGDGAYRNWKVQHSGPLCR